MRVAEGMHVEWVDDEAVVLNPQAGTLHYLNPQAALVYALILEHGPEVAIEKLKESHGQAARNDLDELLNGMRERGLLLDD